ncbi:MAG: ferrous iron transport protein B, partial [Mucilaginibacter polytrichastri]|nr:ferrous iron transport protein B [Mucilaginibacter polytrichastri]
QKVGNFPGVTVDKKTGHSTLPDGLSAEIIDLPGTYSLYPKSADERIVFRFLADKISSAKPDVVVVILDATNLKRNLLLYTQVADLKIPLVVALNMTDLAKRQGIDIDVNGLSKKLGVPVVPISARSNVGVDKLKETLTHNTGLALQNATIDVRALAPELVGDILRDVQVPDEYMALQYAHQHEHLDFLDENQNELIESIEKKYGFHSQKTQAAETIARYNFINDILYDTVKYPPQAEAESMSNRIDKVLTHRVFGFVLFLAILLFIFQSIFSWSSYPMDLIELFFTWAGNSIHEYLPPGPLTNLLADGIVAGLSGVLVFIPQIAILFGFISILEDTGYMARVTFMMDKIMRKVGLNGKSVVPLIGGFACAVPSIMSTRTIENWKDRMITILVVPLTTCSARLPVYVLLISLVVPDKTYWGFLHLQGLVLMGLYMLGLVMTLVVAWVLKFILKSRERGYFIMELPVYRMPRWSNVLVTMYERSKTFVLQAGKVIIAVSIILWVMSSYGPPGAFKSIEEKYAAKSAQQANMADAERDESSEKLEASFAG